MAQLEYEENTIHTNGFIRYTDVIFIYDNVVW